MQLCEDYVRLKGQFMSNKCCLYASISTELGYNTVNGLHQEVSDGLTEVHCIEQKNSAAFANLPDGGHLSYVRLSGGFGTTTFGKRTDTSTYVGLRESVGDTCLSYLFQVRSKKAKGDNNWGKGVKPDQHTPRVVGLSKSLGGDASVHFEHANPDQEDNNSSTALALNIDF